MPGDRSEPRSRAHPGTAYGLAGCLVLLAVLAREPALDSPGFATVWPAGGLAVLWFVLRDARLLSLDTLLLAAAAATGNAVLGADPRLNAVFVGVTVTQTLLAVWLLRRWSPELWGCGGDRPLDRPRMLPRYGGALAVAMAVGALLGTAGAAAVSGEYEPLSGALYFGRTLVSSLIVVTLGILVGQWVSRPRPRGSLVGYGPVVELVAASGFTAAMYGLAFAFDDLPLVFPLLAATVWFGLRFSTLASAAHSFVVGVATQTLTMTGYGPFAAVERADVGTLLAEFYVATIVVTGLALSTGRDERQALSAELLRTQEETLYQASLREAALGSMNEGLFVLDEAGDLLVHNAAAAEMFGLAYDEVDWEVLAARSRQWADGSAVGTPERPSMRALAGETVRDAEQMITRTDGTQRVVSVSAVPLPRDEVRHRARALVIFRDISSEHARRAELAAFAGVVAHDLRNPLAAIDGWTEMIADELDSGNLSADLARDFVSRVRSSSRRMRELIRDLLAHATASQRDLEVERVDLAALAAEVATARHAESRVRADPVPTVLADPVLVRQVLDNLIGNALKYVAAGVEPEIVVQGCRTDSRMVTVQVADNGIGIPAGEHERVFDEFHRAHYRDYEGSGLGLSIVRRIISRHDGTIVARANPSGQGSMFEFTLPAYDGE